MDQYPDIEVVWQHGASPTLFLYEDGELIEEIPLKDLSTEQLHELVTNKGFRKTLAASTEL